MVLNFTLIEVSLYCWKLLLQNYNTKCMEKKLDNNYTRMLRNPGSNTLKNSSCTATYHPSRKQSKLDKPNMQDTAGEVSTSDVLLWTSAHGRAKAGRSAKTYLQQLCANKGCSLEDLPGVMNDREG